MRSVIQCPASDTVGLRNFPASVRKGALVSDLRGHATPQDIAILDQFTGRIPVWGLRQTLANEREWKKLQIGDVAIFYMTGAFRYYATVVHKWIDPSNTPLLIDEHDGPRKVFALKFAMRDVAECHIPIDLYNDLLGFKSLYRPFGPRVLTEEQTLSILSQLDVDDANDHGGEQITLSPEGRRKYRRHMMVERRSTNRTKVLSKKPSICEVCGFDFLTFYGTAVGSYAEVHHLKPLSLGEQHAQSIDDFAVLCANCHRAIHRPSPAEPMSINALKLLIANARTLPRDGR